MYMVFRKYCVFSQTSTTHPSPAYGCKRSSKFSTECECTVTPIGSQFLERPIAAQYWRGSGGKTIEILWKKQIFLNTLYMVWTGIFITNIVNRQALVLDQSVTGRQFYSFLLKLHTHKPSTGCSLNILFFHEFSKVCHLSLASTLLLLMYKKNTSQ